MAKYIYKPDPEYWTTYDTDNFIRLFGKDLKNFFNYPSIQKYVQENNWEKIFEEWAFGDSLFNPNNYTIEPLAFFLYNWTDIDFMSYLDNPTRFGFWDTNIEKVED